jgi:hypothetical protein
MYDNKERYKFLVLRDVVLPRENGGMERLNKDSFVYGPHYDPFVQTGVLRRVEPTAAPVEPEKPSPVPVAPPAPPAEVPPKDLLVPAEPTPPAEAKKKTRAELELMSKRELQSLAPDFRGSKTDLISHLLGE